MNAVKQIVGWCAAAVLLGLCIFYLADRVILPPENARMVVDLDKLTYASIPCVVLGHTDREVIKNRTDAQRPGADLQLQPYADEAQMWTIRDMTQRGEKWHRDTRCNEAGGFDQVETLWRRIFGLQSRWTPDGEWRW